MPNILKGTAAENEEVLTKNRALADKLRRKKLSKMYENGEISSLFNDYNNYISTVQSDYESRKDKYTSYDTSESYRQSKESESSSLSQRLKSLLDLTGGISNYDGKSDLITSLNGAMGTLSGINDDLTNESNYWKTVGDAGVKNDDDYAGYVDRVSKIAADKAATQAETDRINSLSLEEATAERDKYEKQAKEDNTSTNSFLGKILDWSSATTPNHSSWAEEEGSEHESKMALYDNIINKKSNEHLLSLIDDSQAKLFQDYVDAAKRLEAANNSITPDNAYAANYKNGYSSKQQKAAEAKRKLQDATSNLSEEEYRGLLDYYVNQYNDQKSEDFKTNVQSYAGEHPVLSSAGSVLLTMGAGVEGALKSLFAIGGYTAPEHLTPSLTAKSEIRNTVTESIDSNIGKFAYGTGMSMADSAVVMLMSKAGGPVGEALGLFFLGGEAAGTATQDALDNGATPTQAGLSGLAHGIAEVLFEKISLDKILSIDSTSGWKEILKSIGYQFVIEGSEELFTDLANAISDSFILGGKSTLALEYQSYIDAGMSVEDATAKVAESFAAQLGQSFLGGAIAGGLMAGGTVAFQSTVGNAIYDHSTGEALMSQDAGVSSTIDYAKNLDKSSSAYKYAQKLSQKQSNKETIKASNIGKLGRLSSRQTITENGNLYKQGIESRLVELGTSVESASKLSGTILSQITGESVEPIKSLSLSNNKNAQQVLTEIKDTLSADSDNKSQWVQDIQDKVYEAYGRRKGVKEENLQDFVSQVKAYEAAQNVPAEDDVSDADEISTSSPESEPVGTQRTIVTTKSTNKAVTVKSATRSDSGGLVLTLSDGSTASVNDLSMTKSQRAAFSAASEYGINSAEFLAGYVNSGEANIDAYISAYYQIAKSAEYGISSEKDAVAKSSPDAISEDAARSAYAYGKSRNITNNTAGVTYLNKKSISTNKMREISVLDAIGKKYGLQFFIVDSLNKVGENANGNYKEGTNKIWIGLNSDYDSILRTAGHEVFHFIEQYNKDAAADLKNYVIEALKADAEFDYESKLKEIKELYGTVKGAEISDDYAETELAADAMFQVFQREEFVEKLCNEDRSLAEKIKSKLREFISFLKTQVYKISKKDAVAKSMMKDIKKLDTIANMFDDALEGASKIAGADNISTPQNPGAEIKSSIKNNERIIYEAQDSEYMSAVEANDMAKAQSLVDAAAKAAGYDSPILYHGTDKKFYSFTKFGTHTSAASAMLGVFLTDSLSTAKEYSTPQSQDYEDNTSWDTLRAKAKTALKEEFAGVFGSNYYEIENSLWNFRKLSDIFKKFLPEEYAELVAYGAFERDETYRPITNKTIYSEDVIQYTKTIRKKVDIVINWYQNNYVGYRLITPVIREFLEGLVYDGMLRYYAEGDISPTIMSVYVKNTDNFTNAKPPYSKDKDKVEKIRRAKRNGKDGVIFSNMRDGGKISTHYVVFYPSDIKSADPVTYDDSGKVIPLSERFNDAKQDIRYSLKSQDSEGNALSEQQQKYFANSQVTDENGNLLVVYHGSDSDFTVFDKTKSRANMDIQGNFFSPWELDAKGYGNNVKAYYLNITNPASSSVGYKALNRFKGQNNAGVKAREYLISLGYDGVNNDNEEYIAFNSEQIKLVDNKTPTTSQDIRYSLKSVPPVIPTSDKWKTTLDTDEAKSRFPNLWDIAADESDTRNPTQISSTVSSYRKIYDLLRDEGFNGTILDASSGLGYGTKAGIEEYGFSVDDVEPYPDKSYSPKYTDYSALNKKYDVIISNAVLNVLPQDQRDALVVKMGSMLNSGGRLFVNVRGDDVNTLSKNKENINISPMEWYVANTGSYQKGFTRSELVSYLRDALGDKYDVQPTTKFGKTSAIVTKADIRYSLKYNTRADKVLEKLKNTNDFSEAIEYGKLLVDLVNQAQRESTVPETTTFQQASINRIVNKYADRFNLDADGKAQARKSIVDLFTFIADSDQVSWDEISPMLWDTVVSMAENYGKSDLELKLNPAYEQIRNFFKHEKLFLSPGEDHEIATLFGTKYGNVSQQLRGKLNIKRADWSRTSRGKSQIIDAGGRRLDELVSEFNATFPENVRIEGTAFGDTFVNLYDLLGKAWEKTYFVKGSKQSKMSMESSDYDADYEQWNENRLYVVSDEALTASAYELFDDYFDAKEYKTEGQKFQKLLVDTKIKYQHRIESINAKLSNAKDAIIYQKQLRREALLNQRGRQLARDYSRKLRNVQTTLRNMLEHPSKGKFVPDSLVASVSAFCDNITLDLNGFGKTSLGNLREAASMMQTQYNALEQTDPGTFDKAVSGWIAETVNALNNPKMTAMEYANIVKSLYQTLKGVTTNIRNADRAFGAEQRKTITGMSLDAHNSFTELKDKNVLLYKGRAIEIDWSLLKPYAMFETLGNSTFKRLYWELEQGEGVYAKDIDAAKKHHKSLSEKYDIKNKSLKEKVSFESSFGEKVTLTRGELMSLYLYMQRDQAMSHLKRGGFVRKSNIKISESSRKGTFSTDTTHLSGQDYVTIGKLLSENEKGYAKELSNYLGTTMGAKGNSVFKQLYGFDKFTEENYFPIITASDYLNAMLDDKGEVQLTGMGFLKDLVPNASNPIALMDVQEVFAQHVNEMSRYHALVLPLQNITKVLNFRAVTPMTNDDGGAIKFESISADIRSKFGSAGLNSLKQFIRDVNGNVVRNNLTLLDKMISLFKKSATMLSLSTIIQQPTAILRAQAYIDPKYFVSLKGLKVAKEYKQLMEYAPIAVLKRMGSFDTSTGASASRYILGEDSFMEKATNVMSAPPELADELGWSMLWVATKNEVAASGKYENGSEEFYQAAGERFTEVANKSQVYDSIFSRAEIMRSKNLGAKLVTPFMAEPLTTLNMGYTAILDAKRSKTKAGAMRCVRTFYALLSSIALNALLKSLVTAARKDDDDEERGMLEVYATEVITNFLDDINVLNMIPILRDINSLANGYDVERADLSLATKLINYIVAIANKTASDETITLDDYMKLIGSAANFFGIPVANAWRDFKAIGNVYTNVKGLITGKGDESSWVGFEDNLKQEIKGNTWGGKIYTLMTKNTSRARELYNAMVSGDAAKAEKLREMWKSTGKDDAYIDSQLTSCLSMKDARVAKAAEARQKAETSGYQSLIDDIMSDGFSKEMAVGAVDSYISRQKSKDASEAQSEDDGEEASVSIYSNQDVVACLQSDDISGAKKIINYLVDERVKNGKTKAEANASIKSSITSKFKPLYVAAWKERDQSEMTRIRKLLIQSGLYGKSADIDELLKGWRTSK
jgi:hypothetical protein